MKWKDLSLKERKQIYDSVRVNNPGATYFDIKQQFDSIPAYQDGKGKTINKADLPPEYRTGTPEYFERQRKISGAVNTVQPEAYITPAGYIKDAVNFIEDLGKGDYAGAAIDAVLNLIPWGVGKGIKKLKSKVGRIEQAIFPDERTRELVENVDKTYGTNYKRAYSNIAYKDMTKKSHMLTLKRSLKDSGKITNWSTPVDENMILEYMRNPTSNKMVKNQYDLYRNKNEYIDRLNKLIPMEILMPLGGAGFVGHELNKE